MTCRRQEKGFALITALWAALVLALIVSLIVKAGRTDARIAHTAMRQAKSQELEQAAIALVELRLLGQNTPGAMVLDGSPFTVSYAGQHIQMRIQDQAGLIDLNFASGDVLARLFQAAAGLSEMDARTLADKVLDWREKGAGRRLNGAKAADYAAAGFPYGPREGEFESVAELRLVMGVTPAIFDRVASALTVYSQKPLIDPKVAPLPVLESLPGMTPDSAAAEIREREYRRERGESDPVQGLPLAGRSLALTAAPSASDDVTDTATVTIRFTGFDVTPLWVYSAGR